MYSYFDASGENTGELEKIGCAASSGTPDVPFAYTRLGNPATITDAAGTRVLAYHTIGQRISEPFDPGGMLADHVVTTDYDYTVSVEVEPGAPPEYQTFTFAGLTAHWTANFFRLTLRFATGAASAAAIPVVPATIPTNDPGIAYSPLPACGVLLCS
jgi:hypothetical protein